VSERERERERKRDSVCVRERWVLGGGRGRRESAIEKKIERDRHRKTHIGM
jgi:hypothetical protein